MPHQNEIPADHVGLVLKLVECPTHKVHINMDLHLPASMHNRLMFVGELLEVDQMSADEARSLARDLNEAADMAEREIASGQN